MSSLISGEPLRVLLVSPHGQQREEVGDALEGAGEHRFYWVSQPDLALTRAQGLAPHVILLDDDPGGGADAEGLEALVRRLGEGLPGCLMLLLSDSSGLAVAQRAVLAGAHAFVLKPVTREKLVPVLRQVLSRRGSGPQPVVQETPLGRVVVFCGSKGGTGRTTLAFNTAICLREVTREPVVIVDADYSSPALDVALNLRGQRDIRDLLPKLNRLDSELIDSVLASHSSGVRVLLAPPPDQLDRPHTLPQVQQVTAWLKRMFTWVVVDLGLPLDEPAYAFLDAADKVVMSVLPDMVGVRNTKLMLARFDARNYPAGKVWPLLNRDGMPGGLRRPDVTAYLGRELKAVVPNDQEIATETINRGVPLVISHRRRPIAQAYRKLAGLLSEDRKLALEPVSVPRPAPELAAVARADAGGTHVVWATPTVPAVAVPSRGPVAPASSLP